jgi:5-methylcytosine-specific restriction endonuclease McrA
MSTATATLPPLDSSVDYSRIAWKLAAGRHVSHREVDVPYWTAPAGYCRWCGLPAGTHRRRWHPDCAADYRIQSDPRALRTAVKARDGGRCVDCPPDVPPWPDHLWHADHVVELIDGGSHKLTNVCTRCAPHHRAKSAIARRLRASGAPWRREARQGALC